MHLVFFTKNESVKQHFQKMFAPLLKKEFFTDEAELKTFLKNLKVPTQVIIDQKSFTGSITAFSNPLRFHHIIIFNEHYSFEECLAMIRQGLLLMTTQQLLASDWWWNRTLMQVTRKKMSHLSQPSLVLIPPTSIVNLHQLIHENIEALFFEAKQINTLYLSAQQPLAETLLKIEKIKPHHDHPLQERILYIAQAQLWAPHERRYMLEQIKARLPQSYVFMETDGTQTMTEQALDMMTALGAPGIYQLNQRKVEKKIYQQPSIFREQNCVQIIQELLDLEYLRYTWQPEKHNIKAITDSRS